jgi:membrane fusion protein, multidrug efflux system
MASVSEFSPVLAGVTKTAKKSVGRQSRRTKWILAGLAGLILVALAWHVIAALMAGNKKPPPPPPVHVATATRADVSVIDHTIASVVSPATVQVNAQVAGKLLQAYFQEGQIVHKGDPLFLIDPAPFQNALAQARAQLAKDQAAAQSALNDQKRYTALYAANATSQQMRDQVVATAQADVAQVNSDQATVNIAAENLGYTKIVSPIDGKTGPIIIQPGNLITVAGATPLVTITQIQPIKISFFLPQSQLTQIQNQMTAGKLTAIVPMPGAPNGSETAPVDFVSNIVGSATGTIELRATFANDDQRLVPGQSVNIGVTMNQIQGATVVPRDAVNLGPDSSYVYVVTYPKVRSGQGKKDRQDNLPVAVSKTVKVLNDDGTNDAISGDIKPGDTVITDGQLRVTSGAKVAVQKGPGTPQAADTNTPP